MTPRRTSDITTIDDELAIILNDGYTGTAAPEVAYGGDHVRKDAPTYTGEVSFDADTYGVTDTVTVTLVDPDLNTDSDAVDIYPVDATSTDAMTTLLHLEIGGCTDVDGFDTFSLRESASDSGTFEGTFDVPANAPQVAQTPTTAQQAKTSRPPTMTSGTHPAERPNGATLPQSAQTPALSALTGPSTQYRP